ncbi:MAG: S-layer homology domain-containing protein [Oscillospiraceae bacterium]|nr:S-layer homology domain-containing protein [Oscillospiraceae bacterium]
MKKTCNVIVLTLVLTLALSIINVGAIGTGAAPIAENLEISTYRNISVGGMLKATDPDGDVLKFQITTQPSKGEIELKDNGSFVYTPGKSKRGRDYFGYKAFDSTGNMSSEATVIIKIEKQKTKIAYSDMDGSGAYCAAIALAESNIFIGENIGGQYVFCPNSPVTRSDFLTMCLKLTDTEILSGVITTGFADDSAIPTYMKPYVSTALLTGIINGYSNGANTAVFNGDNYISYPEAAVMLNKALNLTDVSAESYGDTFPVWAAQACANLSACRISDYSDVPQLTRADCAMLLYNTMNILEDK